MTAVIERPAVVPAPPALEEPEELRRTATTTREDLLREWSAPGRMLVLINRSHLDLLRPRFDPPPIELASKDKKVLIANRP